MLSLGRYPFGHGVALLALIYHDVFPLHVWYIETVVGFDRHHHMCRNSIARRSLLRRKLRNAVHRNRQNQYRIHH